MNAYKPRIEMQCVELAMDSPALSRCLCTRACFLSDWGKYARRGVNCVGGKSQAEVLKEGDPLKLYPCYSKSALIMN